MFTLRYRFTIITMLQSQPSMRRLGSDSTWASWIGDVLRGEGMFGRVDRKGKVSKTRNIKHQARSRKANSHTMFALHIIGLVRTPALAAVLLPPRQRPRPDPGCRAGSLHATAEGRAEGWWKGDRLEACGESRQAMTRRVLSGRGCDVIVRVM